MTFLKSPNTSRKACFSTLLPPTKATAMYCQSHLVHLHPCLCTFYSASQFLVPTQIDSNRLRCPAGGPQFMTCRPEGMLENCKKHTQKISETHFCEHVIIFTTWSSQNRRLLRSCNCQQFSVSRVLSQPLFSFKNSTKNPIASTQFHSYLFESAIWRNTRNFEFSCGTKVQQRVAGLVRSYQEDQARP